MAEKLYAIVNDQRIENIISLLTEDEAGYSSTLEEGVSLIELSETVKQDWQFYSTSSNSLVAPVVLSTTHPSLVESEDNTSLTLTVSSNTDLTSIGGVLVRMQSGKAVLTSSTLVNSTEISLAFALSELDFSNSDDSPQITFVGILDLVDSAGFEHTEIELRIS